MNLANYLRKYFEFKSTLSETESANSQDELLAFLKLTLETPSLHRKINVFHQFIEISYINFSNIDEKLVKQLQFSKRSGRKKKGGIFHKLFYYCELIN